MEATDALFGVQSDQASAARVDGARRQRQRTGASSTTYGDASGDTVTFSEEALALARNMWMKSSLSGMYGEADEEANDGRRSLSGGGGNVEGRDAAKAAGASGGDSSSNRLAKVEKQIKELQKRIEQVYASDLSDVAKETVVKGLREQMDALMQEKGALSRGRTLAQGG